MLITENISAPVRRSEISTFRDWCSLYCIFTFTLWLLTMQMLYDMYIHSIYVLSTCRGYSQEKHRHPPHLLAWSDAWPPTGRRWSRCSRPQSLHWSASASPPRWGRASPSGLPHHGTPPAALEDTNQHLSRPTGQRDAITTDWHNDFTSVGLDFRAHGHCFQI